ncbi:MAG: MipA/OmpV family protein, partial [Pseudomonadota bacterium]
MNYLSTTSLVFAASMAMSNLQASDINIDNPHFGERGWDVQLGIGVFSTNTAVFEYEEDDFEKGAYIPLEATWYGERFYFVTSQREGLLVGYNLTKNDVWALDAIAGPRSGGPDIDDLQDEFSGLEERDVDFHAGLRYSRYGENEVLRLEVTRDLSDTHDGYFAFGSYKREWQVKNWLVTGRVGVGYMPDARVRRSTHEQRAPRRLTSRLAQL